MLEPEVEALVLWAGSMRRASTQQLSSWGRGIGSNRIGSGEPEGQELTDSMWIWISLTRRLDMDFHLGLCTY